MERKVRNRNGHEQASHLSISQILQVYIGAALLVSGISHRDRFVAHTVCCARVFLLLVGKVLCRKVTRSHRSRELQVRLSFGIQVRVHFALHGCPRNTG